MPDSLVVVKIVVAALLVASVLAARALPPPPRRAPATLAFLVMAGLSGTASAIVMTLVGEPTGALVTSALAVLLCAAAGWLLRAPGDDDGDGGEPRRDEDDPDGPGPDDPDPLAFDWDAFERAGRPAEPHEPTSIG